MTNVVDCAYSALKWHFSTREPDDRGINETRANACEIVAWRFLSRLSERDAIDFVLYELPSPPPAEAVLEDPTPRDGTNIGPDVAHRSAHERTSLLYGSLGRNSPAAANRPQSQRQQLMRSVSHFGTYAIHEGSAHTEETEEEDATSAFIGLNALEIAAVADAKKFLSQRIVQKIIYGIWRGDITFWDSLSVHTKKKAQFYNKRKSDPFSRLRVPLYIKAFEVLFFASFLALYYAVLVERNPYRITPLEILLYLWLAAFAYEELSEFLDAGSLFYSVDFWNSCDLGIILVGAAFLGTRESSRLFELNIASC